MLVLRMYLDKVFQLVEKHKDEIDFASLTQQVVGAVLGVVNVVVVVVSTSAGVAIFLQQGVPIGREAQGGDRLCLPNTAGRGSCSWLL